MPEIGNNIANADINLVDEAFDASKSGSYHLSMQIETGRLSFCVFNTANKKYIALRSYPISFSSQHTSLFNVFHPIFENDSLFRLRYKSSSLLWMTPRCTLVPEHLFDPDKGGLHLTFNQGAVAGEHILHYFIRSIHSCCVFSCPKEMTALVRMYQPNIHFFHQLTPFIEPAVTKTPPADNAEVTVLFYSPWLDVAVVKENKLLFYNSFKINAPADSVYYLAGISNLFDIDLKSANIMYAGNLKQMPPEVAILKDFTGNIVECHSSNAFTYSHYITEPFRRDFLNLFNLYRCE